jgi:hypothetical protein
VREKKAGGYIFRTYLCDHPPLHVHIFDGQNRPVGRWDIEHQCSMKGEDFEVTKQLRKALEQVGYLREEP